MKVEIRTSTVPELKIQVEKQIKIGIDAKQTVGTPAYDGQTTIIPSADKDIVLPTANRVVNKNISVLAIPYAAVSNDAGGYTVSIAS